MITRFRFALLIWALLACGVGMLATAQVPMTGAGKGAPAATAFVGALDVNSVNVKLYAGLDPPTFAFSGNVFTVCDVSTGLICADATAAAGVVTLPTIGGLLCANSGNICNVSELYDTSGQTNCNTGGGATQCPFLQATNSKRPILVVGGPLYMVFGGSSVMCVNSGGAVYTQNQPFTTSIVLNQNGSSTGTIYGNGASLEYDGGGASGISMSLGGATLTQPSINGNWYAAQYVANGSSSTITVDASPTGGTNPGASAATAPSFCIGAYDNSSFFWPGKIREFGQWSGDVGNTINQAVIANQKIRGGF